VDPRWVSTPSSSRRARGSVFVASLLGTDPRALREELGALQGAASVTQVPGQKCYRGAGLHSRDGDQGHDGGGVDAAREELVSRAKAIQGARAGGF
jgi:hypothetical protein